MQTDIEIEDTPFSGNIGGATRLDINDFTHLEDDKPLFATVQIEYVPRKSIMKVASVIAYADGWRQENASPEEAVNLICKELSGACEPMMMNVNATYRTRGGVTSSAQARFQHSDMSKQGPRIMSAH